jgi:hypothetical protein
MSLLVLNGTQSGQSVNDIVQSICDDWGYNPDAPRTKNMILRRVNAAIREMNLYLPRIKIARVVQATANLIAGQAEYNVTFTEADGGFDWANCLEIQDLVFQPFDQRPLEKLTLHQWRQRSARNTDAGAPESWVEIDHTRIRIEPTPDQAYSGVGDYLRQFNSLDTIDARMGWPPAWDAALLAGTEYMVAKARMREDVGSVREFERRFQERCEAIETIDKTSSVPTVAVLLRNERRRAGLPHDNSTDLRYRR